MMKEISIKQAGQLKSLSVRIGVHSGVVHAGLIGWTKMIYDMWGVCHASVITTNDSLTKQETVDIAKLCEVNGMPDTVQVTQATFNQIHHFDFRSEPGTPVLFRDKKIETLVVSAKNFRKDLERHLVAKD